MVPRLVTIVFNTAPILIPVFAGTLRPNEDNSMAGWEDQGGSTSNMWQDVDDNSDSTYVTLVTGVDMSAHECGVSEQNDDHIFGFTNPSVKPSGWEDVKIRIRARYNQTAGPPEGPCSDMTIRVKQGTSTKRLSVQGALTSSFGTFEFDLTRAEILSFTDWDDLRIEADFSSGGAEFDTGTVSPEVAWYEVVFT